MNIHEYQAKELLVQFGVATPRGKVAFSPEEAETVARELGVGKLAVKAQIHAGGRGKGTFKNGFQGGVHICDNPEHVRDIASKMLGQTLVTHQTGPEGKLVRKVLVVESKNIARELYFAITMDRAVGKPVIIASTQGGMDIEEVAHSNPQKIIREHITPGLGLQPCTARKLAVQLGFTGKKLHAPCKLFEAVYQLFTRCDCSLVEINPLVETQEGEVMALDAKLNFDDNGLFRQPDIAAMRDADEEDPREVQASKFNLNYIGLDGTIGCMVNGAGLAMATMDIIQHYGGRPANFLDVGGGADENQVTEAFKILMGDHTVQAILVNIFGGIMRCDIIAQGVINALRSLEGKGIREVPVVVRLEGTNVQMGREMLQKSGLALISAETLADAAEKAVKASKGER
ncbi:MAG: ADP-forming succinate--CoA ligase subunit beta [Verrucomicrobiota bacterium]